MTAEPSKKPGKVVVISGPSGVGKSTICRRLCERLPGEFSVSVTTRPPRRGEEAARDYHFISDEEFARLRENDKLVEWAEVYGHDYGTPIGPIQEAVEAGRTMILEIDIKGCIQVRERLPEARTFFVLPPSPQEQKRRIVDRKTDAAEVIRERLARADGEIAFAKEAGCYEEFVINDDLEETVDRLFEVITAK